MLRLAAALAALALPVAAQEVPYSAMPTPEAGRSVCAGGLCQPEALEPFFQALDDSAAGRRRGPVHVLQIGDSHTAGDLITGALRARLQERFGRGGRGVLPPGVPYGGYQPRQVQVIERDWSTQTAAPNGGASPAYGLSGTRAPVGPTTGSLRLVADPGAETWRVVLCGTGPGTFAVRAEGEAREATLDAAASCAVTTFDRQVSDVELAVTGGSADLSSVELVGSRNGIMVSNLGVVSTTLRDLAARDEATAAAELTAWRPSLIVLAYGTNEGFDDGLDVVSYARLLREQVERMRRLAPGAALLVLGAPDAMKASGGGLCADPRWRAPENLAVVRDVQRRVAADMGVAFWDWRGRMGGDCAADRLAAAEPALMRRDHVHFTAEGADWIGGMLADDLMAAYDARPKAGAE